MTNGSQQRWLVGGLAAAIIVVGGYLLISGDDDEQKRSAAPEKELIGATSGSDVEQLAAKLDHDVYWAGRSGADSFEWTELPTGEVYLRYLTDGAQIGDPNPSFLTVGTYPVGDGLAAIQTAAAEEGAETFEVADGATALVNTNTPSSVYLAYPDSEYQIEVFHPDPEIARDLVESGEIKPIR